MLDFFILSLLYFVRILDICITIEKFRSVDKDEISSHLVVRISGFHPRRHGLNSQQWKTWLGYLDFILNPYGFVFWIYV